MWMMLAERVMSSWALSWAHFLLSTVPLELGNRTTSTSLLAPVRSGPVVLWSHPAPYHTRSGYLRMPLEFQHQDEWGDPSIT